VWPDQNALAESLSMQVEKVLWFCGDIFYFPGINFFVAVFRYCRLLEIVDEVYT
jgi:hypothetical protein